MIAEFDKKFLYDWLGANEVIFKAINSLDGNPIYDSLMIFLTALADHHNFPYYVMGIAIYAAIDFVVRRVNKRGGSSNTIVVWIGIISVFGVAYAVDGMAVKTLKEHFAYPRPYATTGLENVNVLGEKKTDDSRHSFPSGHASFITVVICSLWPVLSGKWPLFGSLLIFAVCWSRLAEGMHYPADVLYGFLLSFIIVLIVRAVVYTLYAKIFKWKC